MTRFKNALPRVLLTGIIGAVAGLVLWFVSTNLGSRCELMCNPMIAIGIGAVFGAVTGFPDNKD